MHVLNTTLPAHLSLFACLDFLRATHCLEYLAFCVPRLFACYSLLGISRFLRTSTLRATHLFGVSHFSRASTLRAIQLFGISRFLRTSTFCVLLTP